MSTSYWMIRGLGFSMQAIWEYVSADKLLAAMLAAETVSLESDDIVEWLGLDNEGRLKFLLNLQNTSFSFADILCDADARHLLSYGNDGESGNYLYYEPCLPWQMREHECKTVEEARRHICAVVTPFLLPEVDQNEILSQIDSIDEVGCG